ncbi:MAG: hypothetical protein E7616_10530 [Ruminococcaceae bacterium]|nr:hypothetical protein [Oscillospiraceae bacterium]
MKNTQFFDLLNGIDDTLLTDALNLSPQPSKTVVLKRFTAAACACLILSAGTAIALVLPGSNNTPPSSLPNTPSQNNPTVNNPSTNNDSDVIPHVPTHVEDIFSYHTFTYFLGDEKHVYIETSLVQCKLTNILGIYEQKVANHTLPYLFAEFEIIHDYYYARKAGEKIVVPISLHSKDHMQEDILKLLNDNEEFFMRVIVPEYPTIMMGTYFNKQGEKVTFYNCTKKVSLSNQTFIPIQNNRVNTKDVYKVLDKYDIYYRPIDYIIEYSDYIADGMSQEELEKNLANLYQKVILHPNKGIIVPRPVPPNSLIDY